MEDFKTGDIVKVTDNSYAFCMDIDLDHKGFTNFALSGQKFVVVSVIYSGVKGYECTAHDIIIKDKSTDVLYLHSQCCLELVEPIKKVTMQDLEKMYGCKVKIIK